MPALLTAEMLYALNRLDEAASAPVKEHLMICAECRERPVEWDEYVPAMRAAARVSPRQ